MSDRWSFQIDIDELSHEIKEAASQSITEEDLKIRVEHLLRDKVFEPLNIPWGRYEFTLVSGIRPDTLYGHVIIEYEHPNKFRIRSDFEKAIEQVKRYIKDHAQVEARFPRYFGIVLDGYKIGFVRYRESLNDFETKGPFEVNRITVARLVEAIVGLRRKALIADELVKDFGPDSPVARSVVKVFYERAQGTTPRTQVLYKDWRRVFSQVCAYSPDKLKGLEEHYGFIKGQVDVERLLFALHTYYALMMKLLAAEITSLYITPKIWSYLKALEDAYLRGDAALWEELKDMEEGGIFLRFGITNFLEADYFAWYLEEWNPRLAQAIVEMVKRLSDYDPSTADLEPQRVRDLFKRLYQNLVPRLIRHDLGEFYTPDWLAELLLDEVGYTTKTFESVASQEGNTLSPLDLRLLDPACGSGTFLILAIERLRDYIEERWIDKKTALSRIIQNIIGFDLNPLAVIAARTNYLIALGDLLREKGAELIEIPIYLADSILVERRASVFGSVYELTTSIGKFAIPASVVEGGLLAHLLVVTEVCIKGKYTFAEFRERLKREGIDISEAEAFELENTYNLLLDLEKAGKNKVWTRILRNSFAPLFKGRFHYVVGNPPWINWENLPQDYRERTKNLWVDYGLTLRTGGAALGKVKRDMAMLFVARCFDRYVEDNGKFGFLLPYTVFKTQAGAGFRLYLKSKSQVLKVHDLVELYPFEGTTNRTSAIILKRGQTNFPVSGFMWQNPTKKGILQELELREVKRRTKQLEMMVVPVRLEDPKTPWMMISPKSYDAVKRIGGSSPYYRAFEGVTTALISVYWIEILSPTPLQIRNKGTIGKRKTVVRPAEVEQDFIFPLIRGEDVKRWIGKPSGYIIVPHDEIAGKPIPESKMKIKYVKTFNYFMQFKTELESRSIHQLWGKGNPFYSVYNIGAYTFAPYKVLWKRIAGGITGKAISFASCVVELGQVLGVPKSIVPDDSLIMVPLNRAEEAYYLSGVLNSSPILLAIASYTYELRMETHITQYLKIPKFNYNNELHLKLAEYSKKAHELAAKGAEAELRKVEEQIDQLVAQLYGLFDEELQEIKRSLASLKGQEVEEEEEEIELPTPTEPDLKLENNIVEQDKPFTVMVVLSNPMEEPLTSVKVKLNLFDGRIIEKIFPEVERGASFNVDFPGLTEGQYKIKASVSYGLVGATRKLVQELTIYVKGADKPIHIERTFKFEDLFRG